MDLGFNTGRGVKNPLEATFKNRFAITAQLLKESQIDCDCDDRNCIGKGYEDEIANHIEDCPCAHCHREMGKISPHI